MAGKGAGVRALFAVMVVLAIGSGCGGDPDGTVPTVSQSATPSNTGPVATTGNGSLFASRWDSDGDAWTKTIFRYAVDESGAVGTPATIASGPADDFSGPAIVDGAGDTVAVGWLTNFWTDSIEVRDAGTGAVTATVEAPRWCGGEGLTYGPCVVADADRLVRTSELGDPAEPDAMIVVSSLNDGTDIDSWGPIRNLTSLFGTTDPGTVLIHVSNAEQDSQGEVQQLDLATGATRSIGAAPADWVGICPIGTAALVGWTPNAPSGAVLVGDATIAEVEWGDSERPVGCSADGRFLYLQQGGGEVPVSLTRVSLADGTAAAALTLEPGSSVEGITR